MSNIPDTPTAPVLHSRDPRGVVHLTMNRPQNFNALGEEMLAALQQALDAVARDGDARVVVLAAAGKAFCPGHNLKEMIARPDEAYYRALFAQCSRMMLSIQKLPVPVIARVQGMATAAGCQLVAQCDLAVASSEASFAVSGVNFGLFCATPSVPLLRNIGSKQAMEMLLTGDFINAEQALQRGLVNQVTAPDQLDAEVERLVQSILQKPRVAIAMGKELFYKQREMGIEAAYQLAGQAMAVNMMDACAQEGVSAFVEKRAPSWRPPQGGTGEHS
ncbi:enoyl-CoA hydratase [Variovorax terrae]|uniref:Enoyl-CoA hydratase domain-containing protein 3, mitochondrial n=1 Tax=Variovorax terrae TaxID=2923278 RepID=A0A9X2ALV9_9BURK|nr:enoyl-CoA hydratase [Variovorax terrae]MCJ0762709.1 enoyl-CoA hydratase [Variovorax terrae]